MTTRSHGWVRRVAATFAVATTVGALTVVGAPSPAFAAADQASGPVAGKGDGRPARVIGTGSLSSADQARQRAQAPLLSLNNRVYDLAAKSFDEQFAGAELDVVHNALVVYWTGDIPAELSALRAEAARGGVTLTLKPAAFSRKAL